MRQYLRKARVTFPGGFTVNPSDRLEARELRVAFSVAKGISGSPNTFTIKLWNLAAGHRNALGKELEAVTLEAGYVPPEGGGNLGIIARGRIRDYQHDREGADIVTTITCGDGDLAYRKSTVSETVPGGTTVPDVVERLYQRMEPWGIARGEWRFPENIRMFQRPYSMCGGTMREMDLLGRSNGFYWSLQNETLEVIPADGTLEGIVLVSPSTGMLGAPTITDNGVKVAALLNPETRPNRQVRVESDMLDMNSKSGTYRISQVDFDGDNQQGMFQMNIQGESLTADGKVDEGEATTSSIRPQARPEGLTT